MEKQRVPPAYKLRVEIVLTLLVKFVFLFMLWFLFFQEPHHPPPASLAIENRIFGPPDSADPLKKPITKEP